MEPWIYILQTIAKFFVARVLHHSAALSYLGAVPIPNVQAAIANLPNSITYVTCITVLLD